jgi:protein-tyrosine phosphatase
MAEGLMIENLRQGERHSLSVSSAGIFATPGNPPDPLALQVAREGGIDISGHRARLVDRENLEWADVVLVMESGQREFISMTFPRQSSKLALLGDFKSTPGGGREIADPYGSSMEVYRICFGGIRDAIGGLIQLLSSYLAPGNHRAGG